MNRRCNLHIQDYLKKINMIILYFDNLQKGDDTGQCDIEQRWWKNDQRRRSFQTLWRRSTHRDCKSHNITWQQHDDCWIWRDCILLNPGSIFFILNPLIPSSLKSIDLIPAVPRQHCRLGTFTFLLIQYQKLRRGPCKHYSLILNSHFPPSPIDGLQ